MNYFENLKKVKSKALMLVVTPSIIRKVSTFLKVFSLVIVLFMAVTPWQQTAKGTGRVVAFSPTDREQTIDAPVDGRIGKWFVQEGDRVKEGDPIVELKDNDPEILSRLTTERQAVQNRLEAARIASKTAKINVERQRVLFEKGISSRRAYELAEIEYARFLTDEANSSAELSRMEVRLSRQEMQFVKAPREGTILRRKQGEGSVLVKSGETLAVLVPETESRAVEIWLDGNDIPLVHEGSKVRLQFEGWPAIQFSGWPSVAIGTFGGVVKVVDVTDNGMGKFRVLVAPDANEVWPSAKYLRQGVRSNAWILLNQVKVGFELWRQFNGFPPSVPENKDSKYFFEKKK